MTARDGWVLAGVIGVLAGMVALAGPLARRWGWGAERARKAVHFGMGMCCLGFPALFSGATPVCVLAALATGGLAVVRWVPWARRVFGGSLHGVTRASWGELLFAPGVALLFVMSAGNGALYAGPLLVLAVGDAVGALAGARYGRRGYAAWRGRKSVEGSAVCGAVSLGCLYGALRLGGWEPGEAVRAAWVGALVATAIEGVLGEGLDNFFLPLGTYVALDLMLGVAPVDQMISAAVVTGLFGVVVFARRSSSLDGGGLLSALLFGAVCLGWGGLAFLVGPLGLFWVHVGTMRALRGRVDGRHAADVVASVAAPSVALLAWHHHGGLGWGAALAGHGVALAGHVAMTHAALRRSLGLRARPGVGMAKGVGAVLVPTCWAAGGVGWMGYGFGACVVPALAWALVRWCPVGALGSGVRWGMQSLLAAGAGWAVALGMSKGDW